MALRRFLNGVTDVSSSNPLGQYPFLDPTKWRVWYEDWTTYDEGQTTTPTWTLTQTTTADAIVTPGKLTLTLTAATNSQGQLQNDHTRFFLVSGKKAIFETKIKIAKGSGGTIGEQGFVVGLSEVATTTNFMDAPPPTAIAVDDFWGFLSYDATTDIVALQGEAGTFSTEAGCATYADDTYMILSVYWDGTKSTFYKDDAAVCSITTNPPTSVVSPVVYVAAGENKAGVLHCDYMFAATER